MGIEIERKFLLHNDDWRKEVVRVIDMRQGYLAREQGPSIRVRLENDKGFLNIKSSIDGIHRIEYEYEIPENEAIELLDVLAHKPCIEKRRHIVEHGDLHFEIDEFSGENAGLIVAEIELPHSEHYFERPEWLGEEVSNDLRYYNSTLSVKPYSTWKE